MQSILGANIEKHIRTLAEGFGVRLAGSVAERKASKYVAEQLESSGAKVHVEEFKMRERAVKDQLLEIYIDGEWRAFNCSLLSNALGTNGKTVEAPLVFFAMEADYNRQDLSYLTGKAVVHLGSHIENPDHYRRLVEAKPAFVMFVDLRDPGSVVRADGMFPAYVDTYGALPIASVAFMHAWHWRERRASAARLCVRGGMRDSTSCNVIAELAGTDPKAGTLFVGAHHDTQADCVGADDNAAGVAILIELTRVLADVPCKRTIRLISFGTEEQLSVGSAEYVRQHREELGKYGRFMLNFDGCGSLMGWTELLCCGSHELGEYLAGCFHSKNEYPHVKDEVTPFSDHFPFAASGMPTVYVRRKNCPSGRFFHHRPDDDMSRVDISWLAKLANISCECLTSLAQADTLPFPREIPEELQIEIEKKWRQLFGAWRDKS